MFTLRKRLVRHLDEPVRSTADLGTRIERLRALSVHDLELAKLLDEIEPYLASMPDPSLQPNLDPRLKDENQ